MTNHPLNLTVYIDCPEKYTLRQVEKSLNEMGIRRVLSCMDATVCIYMRDNGIQVGDMNRISACRRKQAEVPILVFTGFTTEGERIALYKIGIDMQSEYPCPHEEIYLRYMVMARRSGMRHKYPIYNINGISLKYLQLILPDGIEIRLTLREYEIMSYLFRNPGRLIRKSDIMEEIKGEGDFFATRDLDVYLSRIRKHLLGTNVSVENTHGKGITLKINPS